MKKVIDIIDIDMVVVFDIVEVIDGMSIVAMDEWLIMSYEIRLVDIDCEMFVLLGRRLAS